jgi:hypothetical protein
MRDVSEVVEFIDLFVGDYVYWNNKEKTMKLLTELSKVVVFGFGAIFIPLNLLLIIALWYKIFERSHFFWWLFTVIKDFNREIAEIWLGVKYRYILDPPLESLIESLQKENNNFSKKIPLNINIVRDALRPFEVIENNLDNETASHDSGDESPAFFEKLFNSKSRKKKKMKINRNTLLVKPNDTQNRTFSNKDDHNDNLIGDVIKRKINQFKKFTEDIFGDKTDKEAPFVDELRAVVSDEDDLNDEMVLKRAISRQMMMHRRHVKKSLIQVRPK